MKGVRVLKCTRKVGDPDRSFMCRFRRQNDTLTREGVDRIKTSIPSQREVAPTSASADISYQENFDEEAECEVYENAYGHRVVECTEYTGR